MIVRRSELSAIDFAGLSILDFTAGADTSSSLALIDVPAGGRHGRAWSTRSDKYYLVTQGSIRFSLGEQEFDLGAGDFCLVRRGERFSYRNESAVPAQLVLLHTPRFDLASERFAEEE